MHSFACAMPVQSFSVFPPSLTLSFQMQSFRIKIDSSKNILIEVLSYIKDIILGFDLISLQKCLFPRCTSDRSKLTKVTLKSLLFD